jgi:hypothetical protein
LWCRKLTVQRKAYHPRIAFGGQQDIEGWDSSVALHKATSSEHEDKTRKTRRRYGQVDRCRGRRRRWQRLTLLEKNGMKTVPKTRHPDSA